MTITAALLLAAVAVGGQPCAPASKAGMTVRHAAFGGVIAPTTNDASDAVAAGITVRTAARRYLGLDVPSFLIAPPALAVKQRTTGCAFVFAWRFSRARGGTPLPAHVLPHEIGHDLFIRFLVPRRGVDEYGGAAPDWLDEMAAIACEDAAGVAARREEARRHAAEGRLIPLDRLLSMQHPEWRASGAAPQLGGPGQPRSADTPAFYATVRALFDFLVARTGDDRVIVRLAARVREGSPIGPHYLAQLAGGSASADPTSLNAALAAFAMLGGR